MDRPLLILDQVGTLLRRKRETSSPARVIGAMAYPGSWLLPLLWRTGPDLHPERRDLLDVRQGLIDPKTYFERGAIRWSRLRHAGLLGPGQLTGYDPRRYHDRAVLHRSAAARVRDGDLVGCTCARPGSSRRRHPCHLEEVAPHLVRAGWDVHLYDRRLTLSGKGGMVVYAEHGDLTYRPPSAVLSAWPPVPVPRRAPLDEEVAW